jgi:hypothetical protein
MVAEKTVCFRQDGNECSLILGYKVQLAFQYFRILLTSLIVPLKHATAGRSQ